MKRKSGKNKKRATGLFDLIFESRAANIIIFVNFFVFVYLHLFLKEPSRIVHWVLYPGNLLNGNIFCILTSGFIHFDLTHLLLNMLGVFIFARIVERHLGVAKTFYVYFGSLIISMIFSTAVYAFIMHKNVAIIGASGAIMGLIGAAILLDPFCITYELLVPLPIMFKGWMFLYADIRGLLGGEQDGVSHLAHLFGFLSVALLVYFLSKEEKKMMRAGLLINIVSFILLFFLRNWAIAHKLAN